MTRNIVVGLFVVAAVPATSLSAHAGPALTRSVPVACAVNANDGESLKVRLMVKNTSGVHIPEGTKVKITVRYASIRSERTVDQTAWRDVPVNGGIGFDQPVSRYKATACTATVILAMKIGLTKPRGIDRAIR